MVKKPARKDVVRKELARSVLVAIGLIVAALVCLKALNYFFPDLFTGIQAAVAAYGLFGAFIVVLLGSSLAPFPTDAFFVSAVTLSPEPVLFVAVAMVAAFLGGFINYALAFYLSEAWVEKQVGKSVLAEAKGWFDHWGPFAIFFFGVLPISAIIDPLTFVAGLARMDVKTFALYSAAARVVHFGVLALIALGLLAI
ncbi:hypothetical protein AUJ14_03485 [Candidatus Micrarchaeota archaeon CG1_02_55_22]|nr:MAG: hypothetical protein AUJ14_03485 [Candidatus Micrarchaeota archaeon CG1_02_55_22]